MIMELEPLTMGNEVIEFDMMGLGDDTVDDIQRQSVDVGVDEVEEEEGGDGEVEGNQFLMNFYDPQSSHNSISGQVYIPQGDTNLEPYEGMEFESEEAAKAFYNSNLRHEALKYVDNGIQSLEIYNVSMDALQEAANKVALARKNGGKVAIANRAGREEYPPQGSQANNNNQNQQQGLEQPASGDDQDKKIQKLHRKLDRARRKCEVYRANLLSVLKDIEEQKLQLSIKVQNIKLGMKD
ncbi:hypothetical protein D5086_022554 [Populus alba]|uniref:Uncharacterized protein n=1 Tax=Populus alba TaxID=43335 RepID=A0ACC4BFY9_POPAL